jgi:redox-sensing transcriptional repressor
MARKTDMSVRKKDIAPEQIPYSTILRLTQYLRVVEKLDDLGVSNISSAELSEETRINSFLVRKDLSYFGEFGTRGVGYDIPVLRKELRDILGVTNRHKTIVIGAGNLGRALVHYSGFDERGFSITAVFDSSPEKIGIKIGGFTVESVFTLEEYMKTHPDITIGIIAVPAASAQFIANLLVANNIKGILSFAPLTLQIPDDIVYATVDLTTHLEIISYYITHPDARRAFELRV